MSPAYRLASTLLAHEQDVRSVVAVSNDILLSAARDKTVRAWKRISPQTFTPDAVYRGHEHFVNSLCFIKPTQQFPNGLYVSGGSDKLIHVHDPSTPDMPLRTLVGHTENVCALAVSPSGHIISGSWDKKVIVWKNFEQAYTLEGHTAAVWAVLAIEDDLIVTGAADKTIRLWKDGKQVKVLSGHMDAVRGLALLSNVGFVSCSNDATLRIWSLDGECIQQLDGHTSFVYSVAVLPTGEIVSSGEDRTVRVWSNSQCIQTIQQPCISVWTVDALPNGDIAVGGSDSVIRVFTRADERVATQEEIKHFNDLLASQAIPSNQIGDVTKEKLPGPEALQRPGQKEGQVIMVNMGSTVEAHQWSTQSQSWQKIGEVVGGVGSGRKTTFEGKEYDYVFDIDIGGGPGAMLKLPYNVTENPYEAAQKFIWRHELPQIYLDQIADFITKNAQGVELGQSTSQYHDPYTGASRYTPGAAATSMATNPNEFRDPFTGASSYRGAGSSVTTVNETVSPAPKANILPITTYLSLKQANLDAIISKLHSINSELGDNKLPEEDIACLPKIVSYLKNPQAETIDDGSVSACVRLVDMLPAEKRFPALDIFRLLALYAPQFLAKATLRGDLIGFIQRAGNLSTPSAGKVAETNAMLAYRGAANLFNTQAGREIVAENKAALSEILQYDVVSVFKGKAARMAITTLAVNFAVFLVSRPERDDDCEVGLAGSLLELIKVESDDENLYRALVALGTLMVRSDPCREIASIMDGKIELTRIKTQMAGKERIQRVIGEMMPLTKSA